MKMYNEKGGRRPIRISELIEDAQEALAKHGNIPVFLEIESLGYDDNVIIGEPLGHSNTEIAAPPHTMLEYWPSLRGELIYKLS